MNYIEGFYKGDESKLKESLQPTLNKFGFWKNKDSGEYEQKDDIKNVHYTEGGPWFSEYEHCDYSTNWYKYYSECFQIRLKW